MTKNELYHRGRAETAGDRRLLAVVLAVLTLAVLLVPLAYTQEQADAYDGTTRTVTYHQSYNGHLLGPDGKVLEGVAVDGLYNDPAGDKTLTLTYSGSIVATEYNPQVWDFDDKWYEISTYKTGFTLMFTGWVYATSTGFSDWRYPGEVMSEEEMEAATSEGAIHVYATWGLLENYGYWLTHIAEFSGGSVFTNVVAMATTARLNNIPASATVGFTLRGVSDEAMMIMTNDQYVMGTDMIVDSIHIRARHTSNHGDGSEGLYANGHVLVIGTGVVPEVGQNADSVSQRNDFTQVFGGSPVGNITSAAVSRTPYGEGSEVDFGTFVIIHSGVYDNVAGGSRTDRNGENRNIGTAASPLSTYLVVKDVTILDTLVGGSTGTKTVSDTYTIYGSTYVYADGLRMYGDSYEEKELGGSIDVEVGYGGDSVSASTPITDTTVTLAITESSILTGGSNNGRITGDTHVYLSGDTRIWDAQGGGRRGFSSVDTANVEVSGEAVVAHVLCGSITDGLTSAGGGSSFGSPNAARACVNNVNLSVTDSARVGSVFGGGYDTYYRADYASMMGGGDISIVLSGDCVVGYVYGGGYRGDVGTESQPIDSITISITGGTVLADVFGGGRGGVDKILHDANGQPTGLSSDGSSADSTGSSKVYAGYVSIEVSGGRINGDVYGGGESVPIVSGSINSVSYSGRADVASMVIGGDIDIGIYGGNIGGHVFGAGKGVYLTSGDVSEMPPAIIAMGSDGLEYIDWYSGSNLSYVPNHSNYSGYAHVQAENINISFIFYETDQDPNTQPDRYGSIYGGGRVATTDVTGEVNILLMYSSVADGIFGGGMGIEGATAPGSMDAGAINIMVMDGCIVGNSETAYAIYGGGQNAHVSARQILILLESDPVSDLFFTGGSRINGDVHGGGQGSSGITGSLTDANRTIILNGATVYGNIYGGSRLGQDGSSGRMYDSSIYLVTGTVTQCVYGGGFEGESYMNSHIYVGSEAADRIGNYNSVPRDMTSADADLRIGSIYGGGNLNGQGEPYTQSLLKGSAEILVAGLPRTYTFSNEIMGIEYDYAYLSDGSRLRIDGDIYGAGNYSTIDGMSVVYIHDWTMPSDRSMLSIQRADETYIVDSTLNLTGSSDGGNEGISEWFTLNRLGRLQLDVATLNLYAETARIGDYYCMVDLNRTATRADCGTAAGSEIVLHNGVMFSLVGEDGTLYEGSSTVHGFTLLSKPANDIYYGVFAMGSQLNDDNSGFMVNGGSAEADVVDSGSTRIWYQAGHVTISKVVTYDTSGSGVSQTVDFLLPRLYHDNTTIYTYVGSYIDATVQDGLYTVTSDDYRSYSMPADEERMYFSMSLASGGSGVPVVSYALEGGSWARVYQESPAEVSGSNTVRVSTSMLSSGQYASGYGVSGNLGTVTIHMTESLRHGTGQDQGYIPVNWIDLEITVHVRPVLENPTDLLVTVMATSNAGRKQGTGYINLPGESIESMSFRLVSISGMNAGDTVSVWSDTSHLGLSGWTIIRYTESDPYIIDSNSPSMNVYMGEGGIRDTTVGIHYEGSADTLSLVFQDENGYRYDVTVNIRQSTPVTLNVAYNPVDEQGIAMGGHLVLVSGDGSTSNSPYVFAWEQSSDGFQVDYASVLNKETVYYREGGSGGALKNGTIQEALESMFDREVTIEGVPLNYIDHLVGWYTDPGFVTLYDMSSEMKESRTLYAGFGVTVRFNGEGVSVSPSSVVLTLGQSLGAVCNDIGESDPDKITVWNGTGRTGYHLVADSDGEGYSWRLGSVTGDEYDFTRDVFENIDLYLPWEIDEYEFTVTVDARDDDGLSVTVDGTDMNVIWASGGDYRWTATFKAPFGSRISVLSSAYPVESATATYDGGAIAVRGAGTHAATFDVPDVGEDGTAVQVSVETVLGVAIHVSYVNQGGHPLAAGDSIRVIYSGQERHLTLSSPSTDFIVLSGAGTITTIQIDYMDGRSTVNPMMYFSIGLSADGENWSYASGGVRGMYQGTITYPNQIGDATDLYIILGVHRAVTLDRIGAGSSVYVDTDRDGTVGVDDVELSVSDVLFPGDRVIVTPHEGYLLPPSYSYGVRELEDIGSQDGSVYTVNGDSNVSFGDLSKAVYTFTVNVLSRDSDNLSVTVDGNGIPVRWSSAGENLWTCTFTAAYGSAVAVSTGVYTVERAAVSDDAISLTQGDSSVSFAVPYLGDYADVTVGIDTELGVAVHVTYVREGGSPMTSGDSIRVGIGGVTQTMTATSGADFIVLSDVSVINYITLDYLTGGSDVDDSVYFTVSVSDGTGWDRVPGTIRGFANGQIAVPPYEGDSTELHVKVDVYRSVLFKGAGTGATAYLDADGSTGTTDDRTPLAIDDRLFYGETVVLEASQGYMLPPSTYEGVTMRDDSTYTVDGDEDVLFGDLSTVSYTFVIDVHSRDAQGFAVSINGIRRDVAWEMDAADHWRASFTAGYGSSVTVTTGSYQVTGATADPDVGPTFSGGTVTFDVPDLGPDAMTVNVSIETYMGVAVHVTYVPEGGSTLGGDSINVTYNGGSGHISSANGSVEFIVMTGMSEATSLGLLCMANGASADSSVYFTVSVSDDNSIWQEIGGGLRGKHAGIVTLPSYNGESSDLYVKFDIHRSAILAQLVGGVSAYLDADGSTVTTGDRTSLGVGDRLFEGETIVLSVSQGYILPPSVRVGVTMVSNTVYTVDGDRDIRFVVSPETYDVTVNVLSRDTEDFSVTVDGSAVRVSWTEKGDNLWTATFQASYRSDVEISTGRYTVTDVSTVPAVGPSHSGSDVGFTIPYLGVSGSDLTVDIETDLGVAVHVTYVSEGGTPLASGDSITVTYNGETGTIASADDVLVFVVLDGTPQFAPILAEYITGGTADQTMHFTLSVSDDNSDWQTVDGGLRGKHAGTVALPSYGGSSIDLYVKLDIHRPVSLVGLGNGLSAYVDTDGDSLIGETDAPLAVGDFLFEGETVMLEASDGYGLPPSVTEGVTAVDDATYTVDGDSDVSFGDLSPLVYEVTVNVLSRDTEDFSVTVDGTDVPVSWAETDENLWTAVFRAPFGSGVEVNTGRYEVTDVRSEPDAAPGFSGGSATFTVPYIADGGLVVDIDTELGIAVHVTYVSEGGSPLASGGSISVTYNGESGTIASESDVLDFVVLDGSSQFAPILAEYMAGGSADPSVYFTMSVSDDSSDWQTVDGGIRGKHAGTVVLPTYSGESIDLYVKLDIHRSVSLVGLGGGLSAYVDTDGDSLIGDADESLAVGDILFEGETVMLEASDGYGLPPSVTEGVTAVDDATYTVDGDSDVSFGDLSPFMYEVTVNVLSRDTEGFSVTVDGTEAPVSWTETDENLWTAVFGAPFGSEVLVSTGRYTVTDVSTAPVVDSSYSGSDVGFGIPYIGGPGTGLTVDIDTYLGIAVHVTYVSEGGTPLASGDSISVTYNGETGTIASAGEVLDFIVLDGSSQFAPILAECITGGFADPSVHFTMSVSDDSSDWQAVDGGLRGKHTGTVALPAYSGESIDLYVKLDVYRPVTLVELGAGVSATVGTGGDASDLEEGDLLFAGETVVLEAMPGYILPPSRHHGVTMVDDATYTVDGDSDVSFGDLSTRKVELQVTIVLTDPSGEILSDESGDVHVTVTVQDNPHGFDISWIGEPVGLTIGDVPESLTGYTVSASAHGFEDSETVTVQEGGNAVLHLSIIRHDIVYHGAGGNVIDADDGSVTQWDVFSGTLVPMCTSGGAPCTSSGTSGQYRGQLWLPCGEDGAVTAMEIVTSLSEDDFADGAVHLRAVHMPSGDTSQGARPVVEGSVVIRGSDLGSAVECDVLGDAEVSFSIVLGGTEHAVTYGPEGLTVPAGMHGSGAFTVSAESGGTVYILHVSVIPEPHGAVTGPWVQTTYDNLRTRGVIM